MDAFLEFWLWQPSTAAAGSAFKRFLALKPCAALRLTQKLLLAFLRYA
ncbi:hypothetical protein [Campylobacter sp.]|nr:hypothetical protein [Campylobacter sp.]MDY3246846.1 hypothetical protein [Campylobacter sp.]